MYVRRGFTGRHKQRKIIERKNFELSLRLAYLNFISQNKIPPTLNIINGPQFSKRISIRLGIADALSLMRFRVLVAE